MVWSSASTTENEALNFLRHCATPMKLLTSKTLVGIDHFKMASIFEGSIFSSPPPTRYPKYTKEFCTNSHFLIFSSSRCFFTVSNTYVKCEVCSSEVALYTNISSNYTIINESIKWHNTSLINLINIVGALHRSNGIINHSYKPCMVLKATFHVYFSLAQTW